MPLRSLASVCACLCVCPVGAVTFERLDLEISFYRAHNSVCARNFHLGVIAQAVWGQSIQVGFRGEAPVGGLGAEAGSFIR